MVPSDYSSFFDAAAQGAGALIGLLFVVIALRPAKIVGPRADSASRGLAASSFIGLVNAFFVSLLALIPGHNIGIGASVMAVFSLYFTFRLHLSRPGERHIVVFAFSLLAYGIELCLATAYVLYPHDLDLVTYLTFVVIGCFSLRLAEHGSSWRAQPSVLTASLPSVRRGMARITLAPSVCLRTVGSRPANAPTRWRFDPRTALLAGSRRLSAPLHGASMNATHS